MKRSFLLGTIGGICSFVMGILAIFIMFFSQANGVTSDLTVNIVLAFIAGTLGIIGGVIGNKSGAVILIGSGILE